MPIEQQSALRKISSYCGLSERAIKLHDMIDKWILVSSKLYWVDLEISKSIEESTFIRIKSLDVCTEKS
jgi:hypothetical protein